MPDLVFAIASKNIYYYSVAFLDFMAPGTARESKTKKTDII
jgi:hypothetical protein